MKKQKEKNLLGQEILEALEETRQFIKGRATEGRLTLMVDGQPINLRDIRSKLGMTREEFASAFAFKTKTVQNWEQGVRQPTDHTLAYLKVIAANPVDVYRTLHPHC